MSSSSVGVGNSSVVELVTSILRSATELAWASRRHDNDALGNFLRDAEKAERESIALIDKAARAVDAPVGASDAIHKVYRDGNREIHLTRSEFDGLVAIFEELLRWRRDLDGRSK
jgi:hypothetical protein